MEGKHIGVLGLLFELARSLWQCSENTMNGGSDRCRTTCGQHLTVELSKDLEMCRQFLYAATNFGNMSDLKLCIVRRVMISLALLHCKSF